MTGTSKNLYRRYDKFRTGTDNEQVRGIVYDSGTLVFTETTKDIGVKYIPHV